MPQIFQRKHLRRRSKLLPFSLTGTFRQVACQKLIMEGLLDFGLVENILSICKSIYQMAENVKANKERCQRVAQRVKGLEELVLTIKQRGPGQVSVTVENALKELCTTLSSANAMMVKYSRTKAFKSFLRSDSHEDMFCKINESLTDNFQILSGALQIEHGNILQKVYETVSVRRQDEEYCSVQDSPTTSPTTPIPLPSTVPPNPMCSPRTPMPMPVPYIMPPNPMCSPTTPMPMPVPNIMPPMPVSAPMAHMPVRCIVSPRPMSVATVRTCLPGTMAPNLVLRTNAPLQAPIATMTTQNRFVVGSYVVRNPYP
ncbi:uncharacterized protein LOC127353586 isoform X2 [Dicentrarchus labrax]|uniref:uncharacterized protein LOC127353586 isoform X2 n=1 Tax=Dicentrarchus labrax TaxID=13489 RepID=UPI0021F589F5|nr:uncharacterized protein LOC127353586 isoform X2 [Dicentrarchus labrax]